MNHSSQKVQPNLFGHGSTFMRSGCPAIFQVFGNQNPNQAAFKQEFRLVSISRLARLSQSDQVYWFHFDLLDKADEPQQQFFNFEPS